MSRFPLATALPSRLALACAISLAALPAAASDDEAKTLDRVIVYAGGPRRAILGVQVDARTHAQGVIARVHRLPVEQQHTGARYVERQPGSDVLYEALGLLETAQSLQVPGQRVGHLMAHGLE